MSDVTQQVVAKFVEACESNNSTLNIASGHQKAVGAFCAKCAEYAPQQHVNHTLTNKITKEQAVLRAVLQLEEMFELIRGLGVSVRLKPETPHDADLTVPKSTTDLLDFKADGTVNLTEIIDGLVDDSVISSGTASIFGIPIKPFENCVDVNNLEKFAEGHYFREDGKLVKPEGHPKPNLDSVVRMITSKQGEEKGLADFPNYNWSDVTE